jgi:Mn-dependent DtxR family transcriptional regulator
MTLRKNDTLEYMFQKKRPITAKELAIDFNSRASTASELLERMTAQGLCTRDAAQRPREYVLTGAGLALAKDQKRPAGTSKCVDACNFVCRSMTQSAESSEKEFCPNVP